MEKTLASDVGQNNFNLTFVTKIHIPFITVSFCQEKKDKNFFISFAC